RALPWLPCRAQPVVPAELLAGRELRDGLLGVRASGVATLEGVVGVHVGPPMAIANAPGAGAACGPGDVSAARMATAWSRLCGIAAWWSLRRSGRAGSCTSRCVQSQPSLHFVRSAGRS